MIVNYFDLVCVPIAPFKTNAPLPADPYAVNDSEALIGIPAWPHSKYANQRWLAARKENPPFPNTQAVNFRLAPAESPDIPFPRRCEVFYGTDNALAKAPVQPSNVLIGWSTRQTKSLVRQESPPSFCMRNHSTRSQIPQSFFEIRYILRR